MERWPIKGGFTISRGSKHEAVVVPASLTDGTRYRARRVRAHARYGESVEGVVAAYPALRPQPLARRLSRAELARIAACRCRAQRARLRAVGPRGETLRQERRVACPDRRAPSAHRLHALARPP